MTIAPGTWRWYDVFTEHTHLIMEMREDGNFRSFCWLLSVVHAFLAQLILLRCCGVISADSSLQSGKQT